MGRKLNPEAVEADRKKKRITVPLSAADAAAVTRISALRGFPSSRVVAYMVGTGVEIEQQARVRLDPPRWPSYPIDPLYVQAAFSPFDFLDLVEIANSAFEPLKMTASAMFRMGLSDYERRHT